MALDRGVILLCSGPPQAGKLTIGEGTYVNRHTMFDVHEQMTIGRTCMIGPYCYLTDADHGSAPGMPVKEQPMRTGAVVVEDDVWIGAGATILSGVRIGAGAVVGAGSVVTEDVPPSAVVAGVPARPIRKR